MIIDSEILNRPCFYFKLLEFIMAMASTILYFQGFDFHYTPDPSVKILIAVAVPNSLANISTLIVMWIFDMKNEVLEISFIVSDGALYLGLGMILLCNLTSKANSVYAALTGLCIFTGILFMADAVVLIKCLENDKKN